MRGLRVMGHPLHPALAHFPVALWAASLAADGAALARDAAFWGPAAWWCLMTGLAAAALAVVAGFVDYSLLPQKHPAFGVAVEPVERLDLPAREDK